MRQTTKQKGKRACRSSEKNKLGSFVVRVWIIGKVLPNSYSLYEILWINIICKNRRLSTASQKVKKIFSDETFVRRIFCQTNFCLLGELQSWDMTLVIFVHHIHLSRERAYFRLVGKKVKNKMDLGS